MVPARHTRILDSVTARFSKSATYRDFLQSGAEAAIRQAEAEAEVARRSADAIVAAQQQLLEEIEQWNAVEDEPRGPADILPMNSAEGTHHAVETVAAQQAVTKQQEPLAAAPAEPLSPAAALLQQLPVEPLEAATPLPTNLIEFPRQLVAARRARPNLALGPLREVDNTAPERAQLRIFEVEASSVSTVPAVESVLPEWHTIRLDAPASRETAQPGEQISFAIPLQVAPRSLRVMAMMVDTCCIATSFLLAVAAAACVSPELPTGLNGLLASGVLLFALGLFYQLLFFSLSDATPGMRYSRIGLCTFSDENPTRNAMRRRVGALLLAGMPLGLGLIWTCLDEDGLGWHDRISRMYPRAY
jgi:hypothetical protein